ncbi:MAG TPA: hypothetical protein VK937_10550 [Candidatus Limnocylindria bacterium]|nr:hypothetical protein [Candidatus Limnocylindria bacterium]
MSLEDRPVEQPHAAGVDIGAREIFVAVPTIQKDNRCGSSLPSPKILGV